MLPSRGLSVLALLALSFVATLGANVNEATTLTVASGELPTRALACRLQAMLQPQ